MATKTTKIGNSFLSRIFAPIILLVTFVLIVLSNYYNFLLFHITVEVFTIMIASGIFLFSWNTRKISKNHYFLFLGIGFLFTGIFIFLHALSYKGMNIFPQTGSNLATQLWLVSRFFLVASFLIAPIFINKKFNEYLVILIFTLISIIIFASIFYLNIFPKAYIEGIGLTDFKIRSEYIIMLLFIVCSIVLFINKENFDRKVFNYLLYSFYLIILGEIFFTEYADVYGTFNVLGHIANFIAFYLIYKAILEVGLTRPYNLLFLELKKLDEKKDELLSIAGHEIRNPLTAIQLSTGLLAQQITKSDYKKTLNDIYQIKKEAERINSYVADLLDVSRIESGKMSFVKNSIYINDFLIDNIHLAKQIYPDYKFDLKLLKENLQVKVDEKRIGQVLDNLISNAVKYSKPKNKIIIKARKTPKKLIISVKDFGVGIEAKDKKRIFEKYYRIKSDKIPSEGLGLGLYITKQIVLMHKGKIWVRSSKHKGSTFSFSLPLK